MFQWVYWTSSILKLKRRRPNSKKGDFGKILIIGGSEDYAGAPLLAGLAAKATQKAGADWTTVAAPSRIAWLVNTMQLSLVTVKLDGGEVKEGELALDYYGDMKKNYEEHCGL